jgi:AcrR family transcriptional regulator
MNVLRTLTKGGASIRPVPQMMNPNSPSETTPRPLRERLKEETAREIANAAEVVFAQKGVRAARMEEIAQKAGVAVGTVYNHFEDREALLEALIERRRAELVQRLDKLAIDAKQPFEQQLHTFVTAIFEHFEVHRSFLSIQLESDSQSWANPSAAMREVKTRGQAMVQRGIAQKVLQATHKELYPSLLFGSIRSLLVFELLNPGKSTAAQRAQTVCEFFMHGAAAK